MQELPFQNPDMISRRRIVLTIAAIFLGIFASSTPAQPETSGTLRLGDLFQSAGHAPVSRRVPGTRLGRSMIVVPDTSTWKLPPAQPTAEQSLPIFEGMSDIPKIPLLIQEKDRHDRRAPEPAFRSAGRVAGESLPPGFALLTLENRFEQLRCEYRLIPVAEPGAPPREQLTVLQAPGSSESFAVPEGAWLVERQLWLPTNFLSRAKEIYPEQRLVSRTRYDFQGAEADEATVIRRDLNFVTK